VIRPTRPSLLRPILTIPTLYNPCSFSLTSHGSSIFQTDPCGIQLFHLLSHTEGSGGATLLVDGFYVASILKETHPDAYEILSRVRVPAHAAGESDSLYVASPPTGYPILGHDVHSQLVQVRWNNDDRSVMDGLKSSEVEAWSVLNHTASPPLRLTSLLQVRCHAHMVPSSDEPRFGVLGPADSWDCGRLVRIYLPNYHNSYHLTPCFPQWLTTTEYYTGARHSTASAACAARTSAWMSIGPSLLYWRSASQDRRRRRRMESGTFGIRPCDLSSRP
jgi:hypothetical protein